MKSYESSIEFFKEATTVSHLKHENIVEFIGVCLENNYLIMELMEGGQLLEYLHSKRQHLTLWDLVDMTHDLAKGIIHILRHQLRWMGFRVSLNPQGGSQTIQDFLNFFRSSSKMIQKGEGRSTDTYVLGSSLFVPRSESFRLVSENQIG